jgi:hypothetical protein
MKLTPVGYLYISKRNEFVKRTGREPNEHEKLNMYTESDFDYKHASLNTRLMLERHVEIINDTNFVEERIKCKNAKSRLLKAKK